MDFREQLRRVHLKATPMRMALLNLLAQQGKPMSIKALHTSLSGDLSTLYRNLNSLCDKGVIEQVHVNDESHFQLNTHKHFIICKKCHKLQPLSACPMKEDLKANLLDQSGFVMTDHKLELYGYCKNCNPENE